MLSRSSTRPASNYSKSASQIGIQCMLPVYSCIETCRIFPAQKTGLSVLDRLLEKASELTQCDMELVGLEVAVPASSSLHGPILVKDQNATSASHDANIQRPKYDASFSNDANFLVADSRSKLKRRLFKESESISSMSSLGMIYVNKNTKLIQIESIRKSRAEQHVGDGARVWLYGENCNFSLDQMLLLHIDEVRHVVSDPCHKL